MQLQRIELKKLGTTERILRSDTQGNFDKLENAVNYNAGATEAWYKQLSSNLAAETDDRQADDTAEAQTRAEADKALEDKLTAEAQTRAEADKALEDKLTAEAQTRAETDKALEDKLTAEAQTRAEADKELDGKIDAEAQTRAEADQGLEQRIARLERYIFDGQPAFVDNLFPPQKSNGSIEVADNGELPPDPDAVVDGEVRDTPTNIFI